MSTHLDRPLRAPARAAVLVTILSVALQAQGNDASLLTVERIFGTREFAVATFGPTRWLNDSTYTSVEPAESGSGVDLVSIDAASGRRTVLVSADLLRPAAGAAPLEIEDYE